MQNHKGISMYQDLAKNGDSEDAEFQVDEDNPDQFDENHAGENGDSTHANQKLISTNEKKEAALWKQSNGDDNSDSDIEIINAID